METFPSGVLATLVIKCQIKLLPVGIRTEQTIGTSVFNNIFNWGPTEVIHCQFQAQVPNILNVGLISEIILYSNCRMYGNFINEKHNNDIIFDFPPISGKQFKICQCFFYRKKGGGYVNSELLYNRHWSSKIKRGGERIHCFQSNVAAAKKKA